MNNVSSSLLHLPPFGVETIKELLPHRHPFLFLDRVLEICDHAIVAEKDLSPDEEVFKGHFPGMPVFPGVLQVEAMAQTGAVWILNRPEHAGKVPFLMTVKEGKFRSPAKPGETLRIHGEVTNMRSRIGELTARIEVDGKEISSCVLMFAFAKDDTGSRKAEQA